MREICKSTVSQRYILTDIQKEYHISRLVNMDRVHTRNKEENMTQDGPKVDLRRSGTVSIFSRRQYTKLLKKKQAAIL